MEKDENVAVKRTKYNSSSSKVLVAVGYTGHYGGVDTNASVVQQNVNRFAPMISNTRKVFGQDHTSTVLICVDVSDGGILLLEHVVEPGSRNVLFQALITNGVNFGSDFIRVSDVWRSELSRTIHGLSYSRVFRFDSQSQLQVLSASEAKRLNLPMEAYAGTRIYENENYAVKEDLDSLKVGASLIQPLLACVLKQRSFSAQTYVSFEVLSKNMCSSDSVEIMFWLSDTMFIGLLPFFTFAERYRRPVVLYNILKDSFNDVIRLKGASTTFSTLAVCDEASEKLLQLMTAKYGPVQPILSSVPDWRTPISAGLVDGRYEGTIRCAWTVPEILRARIFRCPEVVRLLDERRLAAVGKEASVALKDGCPEVVRPLDERRLAPVGEEASAALKDGCPEVVRPLDERRLAPVGEEASAALKDGYPEVVRPLDERRLAPVGEEASVTLRNGSSNFHLCGADLRSSGMCEAGHKVDIDSISTFASPLPLRFCPEDTTRVHDLQLSHRAVAESLYGTAECSFFALACAECKDRLVTKLLRAIPCMIDVHEHCVQSASLKQYNKNAIR